MQTENKQLRIRNSSAIRIRYVRRIILEKTTIIKNTANLAGRVIVNKVPINSQAGMTTISNQFSNPKASRITAKYNIIDCLDFTFMQKITIDIAQIWRCGLRAELIAIKVA